MKTISKGKVTKIALLSALVVLLSVCVSIFAYQITPVKAEAAENTEEPQITLVGANVSLKDSVNIVYAAAVKGYDYTKYKTKLLVWKTPQAEYTKKNCDVVVDSSYHDTIASYSCDMFYYGMPAKNIVDQLYVRAYVEIDGKEYYSGTTKYSLLEYLYDQLSKSGLTEYQKRMYEIILKYGGRAQDLFDYLRNRRADDTFYSIHVENGTFADGFTRGMFLENEEVVMKANAAPEGKKFAYWQDMNGIILGYEEVLTVKATSANTYTAVFVNKITVAEQLHLKASVAYNDDISAVNLPDIIEIKDDAGKTTSSIKVTWDKAQFVKGQIGDQVLTATPADEESKALLGNNVVTMTVTVMPYTFEVDTVTGNYHITKYCGSEAKVSIPEEYRGKPVDTINALAFNAVLSMTELYIPDTITKIEKNAFNACDNIETIRIPFIGDSLSTSNIFGYIFGTDSYEMQKSFVPVNLHKVIISDQVTNITNYAFYKCEQIQVVILSNSLERICDRAFEDTKIACLSLPISMKHIGNLVFRNLDIKRIDISDLNSFLNINSDSTFGGNAELYLNGKLVTEVRFPDGIKEIEPILSGISSLKKVVIPDSATNMRSNAGAFENCKNLEEVVFEGTPQIKEMWNTFRGCSSLKSVHIPASVTGFYNYPFGECNFESVYYDGSFEDWCKIGFSYLGQSPMPYTERFYYKKENGYEELTENVVIPETITQINAGLSGYKALRSVTLHEGVTAIAKYAFQDCVNLSSIKLPSQLKFIGEQAFSGCKSLYSINIPKYISVSGIGNGAFAGCYNLAEVYNCSDYIKDMEIGSDSYGGVAKYAKVIRTDNGSSNIVHEGDYAMFKDGDEYILLGYFGDKTSLVLPEIATSINAYAFYENQKITSVTFGSNITAIGDVAFSECYNLVEVVNKSGLNVVPGSTENGYVAYYAQKVLNSEDEKGEVFNVGDYSFYKQGGEYILYRYNGSDKELTLPGLIDGGHTYKIGREVFRYRDITIVVIPESVTAIGDSAFSNCQNLTSIVIPESVETIGASAFGSCSSLTSVVIPESVTAIGKFSFSNCQNLTSVVIGENVSTIGIYAFNDCSNLTNVEFKNPEGWKRNGAAISADDLRNSETAATYLKSSTYWDTWTRENKGE